MPELECSLLSDGSSDTLLLPILEWVVRQHAAEVNVQCRWADLRRLPNPPTALDLRIRKAIELYPCDVLFIHRDAESQPPDFRYQEIQDAVANARLRGFSSPHMCVVPVRMTEAWLLLDEAAIRRAAGNPHGRIDLDMPGPGRVESIPDPKATLHDLLTRASGRCGRRRKKFRPGVEAHRVTEHMTDFSCLRALQGFQRLETGVEALLRDLRATSDSGSGSRT